MRGVLTAEAAVLAKLQLLRIGLLVLHRRVVLALALAARQADVLLHGLPLKRPLDAAGREQAAAVDRPMV